MQQHRQHPLQGLRSMLRLPVAIARFGASGPKNPKPQRPAAEAENAQRRIRSAENQHRRASGGLILAQLHRECYSSVHDTAPVVGERKVTLDLHTCISSVVPCIVALEMQR